MTKAEQRKQQRAENLAVKAKFAKIAALREAGEHSTVRKLSDTWGKRRSNNVAGLYKAKNSKAGACHVSS